jgi:hypothetical protein
MELNWDAIGAVGEILGAAAVLITLLYLVKQLRHAIDSSQSSGTDRLIRGFDDINRMVVSDADLREVLLKEAELTPSEEEQLYMFAVLYCNIWYSAQTGYDRGEISEEMYATAAHDVLIEVDRLWPRFREQVERWLENYPQIAQSAIFKQLEKHPRKY